MASTGTGSAHTCHARDCERAVAPKLLMCLPHWLMVPGELRAAVWANYVPGQEVRKDPTRDYLAAARAAVEAVWEKEQARNAKRKATPAAKQQQQGLPL